MIPEGLGPIMALGSFYSYLFDPTPPDEPLMFDIPVPWGEPIKIPLPDVDLTLNVGPFIDEVMGFVREKIHDQGLDNIVFPDLNFTIQEYGVAIVNTTFIGAGNLYRIGEATISPGLTSVIIKYAFSVYNTSLDQDIVIHAPLFHRPDGHVNFFIDNMTVFQSYRYITLDLKMDEFRIFVGDFEHTATGLGTLAATHSWLVTQIVTALKDHVANFFAMSMQSLFNIAIQSVKQMLIPIPGIG